MLFVRNFLKRNLQRSDLGKEVGSINYIEKSHKYFLRTKALQKHTFLPEISSETAKPIYPKVFNQMDLKEGDIIISKDSNIGEIVILDKDYPDYMLSGALYKLPVKKETKYYLLAFIKHPIFREQLNFKVPKGATIRHAKTLFLDCKIPIPNTDKENIMKYVSVLTQSIINKEKAIRIRHKKILESIENELMENQNSKNFNFQYPTFNEIDWTDDASSAISSTKIYTHTINCGGNTTTVNGVTFIGLSNSSLTSNTTWRILNNVNLPSMISGTQTTTISGNGAALAESYYTAAPCSTLILSELSTGVIYKLTLYCNADAPDNNIAVASSDADGGIATLNGHGSNNGKTISLLYKASDKGIFSITFDSNDTSANNSWRLYAFSNEEIIPECSLFIGLLAMAALFVRK